MQKKRAAPQGVKESGATSIRHPDRKTRKIESPEQRASRMESEGQQRRDIDDAYDKQIDEMVRKNIERHGA